MNQGTADLGWGCGIQPPWDSSCSGLEEEDQDMAWRAKFTDGTCVRSQLEADLPASCMDVNWIHAWICAGVTPAGWGWQEEHLRFPCNFGWQMEWDPELPASPPPCQHLPPPGAQLWASWHRARSAGFPDKSWWRSRHRGVQALPSCNSPWTGDFGKVLPHLRNSQLWRHQKKLWRQGSGWGSCHTPEPPSCSPEAGLQHHSTTQSPEAASERQISSYLRCISTLKSNLQTHGAILTTLTETTFWVCKKDAFTHLPALGFIIIRALKCSTRQPSSHICRIPAAFGACSSSGVGETCELQGGLAKDVNLEFWRTCRSPVRYWEAKMV